MTVNTSNLYYYLLETNVGQNGADPCQGDSGGPLLLKGADRAWRLVAVLLGGGFHCAADVHLGDKTSDWSKVSVHVPWIRSIIIQIIITYSGSYKCQQYGLVFIFCHSFIFHRAITTFILAITITLRKPHTRSITEYTNKLGLSWAKLSTKLAS